MPTRLTASSQIRAAQLAGGGGAGSQDPAPLNTATSPRWTEPILLTRIRSLTWRVFSIDPEGMENTCTTKALSRIVKTRAATTMIPRSRQKDRLRLSGAPEASGACSPSAAAPSSSAREPGWGRGSASGSEDIQSVRQRSAGGDGLPPLLDPG